MRISDEEFHKLYRTPLKDIPAPVMFSLMTDQQDLRNHLKIAKAALEEIGRPRGNCCGPMMSYQCEHNKARETLEQLK